MMYRYTCALSHFLEILGVQLYMVCFSFSLVYLELVPAKVKGS